MAMLKGVSLPNSSDPTGDNLYTDRTGMYNRTYLRNSGVQAVSFWVTWDDSLAGGSTAPANICDAFNRLSLSPRWAYLDAQIASARADGMKTILTFYHRFPSFTRLSGSALVGAKGNQENDALYPGDVSASSQWAWFVQYVASRYAGGVPTNATGPHAPVSPETNSAYVGNPWGAVLDWIQVMNEPNYMWWPQCNQKPGSLLAGNDIYCPVTTMATSAGAAVGAVKGVFPSATLPRLMLPGTADNVGNNDGVSSPNVYGTDRTAFSKDVLSGLQSHVWPAGVGVDWSHHNYEDVKLPLSAPGTSRVDAIRTAMATYAWQSNGIYLTEGGYKFVLDGAAPPYTVQPQTPTQETKQNTNASANYALMKSHESDASYPLKMWTNYTINSSTSDSFDASLLGPADAAYSPHHVTSTPRPFGASTWPTL